ncbi:MAG TPA: tetratricopeptide repeat protein [Blastocatellia bacterium]|nr:tetratricopeptide repeat protein [Blastocatellia bacterium]
MSAIRIIRSVFITFALLIATAPAFSASAFSASAFAQGQHTLQGKVSFPNGMVPSNPVKITLTFNGRRIYELFTDLSGRFIFPGLARGTYQLSAEGDGQTFETTSVYADVSAYGSAPQNFTQNIQLTVKRNQQVPVAGVISADAIDANMPESARKAYEKGAKSADSNKANDAIKHLQEAIQAYPNFYAAHALLGDQYSKLQRYDEAVSAFQKAIDLKSDGADAHVGLGVTFVKQKRYNEAIAPLRKGVELNKQSSTPYLFLGLAEMFTGDYAAAEADLLRAYEIGKQPMARLYLANLYEMKGDPARAIIQLKAFLKETPNLNEARQADIRQAIEKLEKKASGRD